MNKVTGEELKKVTLALSGVTRQQVYDCVRAGEGEVNKVYIIEVMGGEKYVLKVFRWRHWPEDDKIRWLEMQLSGSGVVFPKTLFYTREQKIFPYGFMVSEFVDGDLGKVAIAQGKIGFIEFHKHLANLLNELHKVEVAKYGVIGFGKGEQMSLVNYQMDVIRTRWMKVSTVVRLDVGLGEIEERVKSVLENNVKELMPVVNHGDATPDNVIVAKNGELVLIDWDGAVADAWIRDFAWITYFGSHMTVEGSLGVRQQKLRQVFVDARGCDYQAYIDLENAYHIIQAIDLLPYYYFDQQNASAFNRTVDRLAVLLK